MRQAKDFFEDDDFSLTRENIELDSASGLYYSKGPMKLKTKKEAFTQAARDAARIISTGVIGTSLW